MKATVVCVLALLCCAAVVLSARAPRVQKQFVVDQPPWPYAHVCSITEQANGDVVATWQAGSGEKHPDSAIWTSTRSATTGSWSPTRIAVQRPDNCVMNSCQYQNASGALYLTFHTGGGQDGYCVINSWKASYAVSTDQGKSWQTSFAPLPGCENCNGCVKNQCITLSNGEVLCPSSDESPAFDSSHMETTDATFSRFERRSSLYFFYSDVTKTACDGIVQPLLFETAPGRVLALFRSQGCGVIAQATSSDYGHTWPKYAADTPLPNPGAGIGGTTMTGQPDIGLLLAYNNNTGARTPLSVGVSADHGATWRHVLDLETDPAGSFAYPFVVQSRVHPRLAHVCYTYSNSSFNSIAYAQVDWS